MMISTWRKRRAARRAEKEANGGGCGGEIEELTIPTHFRCPISLDLMKDPVTLPTGITYDRESIEKWIETGNNTCPITNRVLKTLEPIPNHTIRKMIQDWCVDNRSHGIERIPTPRVPVSSKEVSEILSKIETTTSGDESQAAHCRDLVAKIKRLAKESERNRRCFLTNGSNDVLTATFDKFSKSCLDGGDSRTVILEEILSTLTVLGFNSDDAAAISRLASSSSLNSIVWFLKSGDLSRRRNAVLVLKEIKKVNLLSEIEGVVEALVRVIKEPICSNSTKAALMIIYHMITSSKSNERIISMYVEMGLVELLLEMLVDAQRSICEKALGVLDGICSIEIGRQRAYSNALTVPVLVKKILRVSELATEFAVSLLWKLCKKTKNGEGDDGVISGVVVEALRVGAFQKLLLLLQVGSSGERTKEKVTDLLKLLNLHRDKVECIDSMDFKNLKRPF